MNPHTNNLVLNGVRYGGQNPDSGITMHLTDSVSDIGDIVGTDSSAPASVKRTAAGTLPVGLIAKREGDGLASVYNFEKATAVRYTGTLITGPAGVQCDGNGNVQFVSQGTASSLTVNVLGAGTKDGTNYAVIYRL